MAKKAKKPIGSGNIVKLTGNRTRPYCVRMLMSYELNQAKGTAYPKYKCIGYAKTLKAAKKILADYLDNP